MELMPGYKQTEVGVIPEDWDVSTVGREFEIKLGKMLDAEKNTGVPKPYLGNKAVQWGRIDVDDLPTVPMTRADIESYRLRKGDLLVCEGGEVGRAAIWHEQLDECYYQKAIHRLRALHGFEPYLMVGLLRQWADSGRLANYVTKTSIAHLPREKFLTITMPVPPQAEQRSISKVLRDLDGLLAQLNGLIVKKRSIKQATMQELLTGKRRLPGFEGEWAEVSLGSVAAMNSGGTPPTGRDDFYGGGNQWVSISDMTSSGRFISETERTLSDLGLANCAAKRFPAGTILYAMYASLGECSMAAREVTTSQAILGIRPSPSLDGEYLYYWLDSIRGAVKLMGQQGTQSNLNKKIVQGFSLKLPSKTEQKAIAKVLREIDQDIDALKVKAEKTRAMKSGMMQQLLTGRIRLQ